MRFCKGCVSVILSAPTVQCKSCWREAGCLCVRCGRTARTNLERLRCCTECCTATWCLQCKVPPPADIDVQKCRICSRLSLWCKEHYTESMIQSRLCLRHSQECDTVCILCGQDNEKNEFTWRTCRVSGCEHEMNLCDTCVRIAPPMGFHCISCWRDADKMCIKCDGKAARSNRVMRRLCFTCHSLCFAEGATKFDLHMKYLKCFPQNHTRTEKDSSL